MLRNTQELNSYTIAATDGEVGKVADVFFDDRSWVVRYLVVDTGSWLTSRKVLISPYAAQRADWNNKRLRVSLNREQVKNSPDIDTDRPVSLQHETAYADYYRYPYYWAADGWGEGLYYPLEAENAATAEANALAERARRHSDDPHLRSSKAIVGYHIHATDGDIGHVQSMLVDEGTWSIRYLVVDTSNWWLGHSVLVPPEWISAVNWADSSVSVNLSRETVKNGPRYESTDDINRSRELELHSHYGRPTYWEREHARETAPAELSSDS